MSIVILIISLLLVGIINNSVPYLNLSLFTPLLTLISVIVIYPLYKKEDKKYLIIIFVTGIIYDLLYTNLLFYNGVLFLVLGLLNIYINKKIEVNYLTIILILLLNITLYVLLNSIILYICNIVTITPLKIVYIYLHSLILNMVYGYLLFVVIKKKNSKKKSIKLN